MKISPEIICWFIKPNIQIYSVNSIIKIYTKVVTGEKLAINSCKETKVISSNLEIGSVDGR